jgi:PAS domain S-box-containing protein
MEDVQERCQGIKPMTMDEGRRTKDEGLRLFLVEDNDDIALLVRKALERAGHQVTRCRTAADALTVLAHQAFDLVLLDQRLPDMPGIDLLHALQREGIVAPALMVTGHGDEQLASQVLRAGALDYLVKDHDLLFLTELPKRVQESVLRHRLLTANGLLIEALESARDGILITDLQGTILHVNRALEGMTGYTRQELLGGEPSRLFSEAARPDFLQELTHTVQARSSWQGESPLLRKDGSSVDVSLTVSPIVDGQGQLRHAVIILRDVSDRKHLERQLLQAQKMQSVGTLAGGVAHEFNNLLAGINGYAALALREPGLGDTVREFLAHIEALSERAAVLTRQLLTFARKPPLVRRPTAPAELLAATRDLLTRTMRQEVVVETEAHADGAPLLVEADPNQLQQALVNLALNAHDALKQRLKEEGGRMNQKASDSSFILPPSSLVFRLRRQVLTAARTAFPQSVPPGDYVVLEVADRGCGMNEKVLGQALDPFFTTKEVGKGTGLGLPVVFGIIQAHQGFLTIDTAPGRGTRVSLYLRRLVDAGPLEPRAPFEAGQVLEPETGPSRAILVVDDEEALRDVVRRFLEIAGHRVSCAGSGQEAIDRLTGGEAFDLVILDLMMPREDGLATFRWLRQRCPHLPVLLCTGIPQEEAAPPGLANGSAGVLRKPFRMNELWYAVKRALATGARERSGGRAGPGRGTDAGA